MDRAAHNKIVPFSWGEEGAIGAFIRREVQPYTPYAWVNHTRREGGDERCRQGGVIARRQADGKQILVTVSQELSWAYSHALLPIKDPPARDFWRGNREESEP